ncbi:MAG: hypothetical protein ABJH68_12965 [Ilumatobacter sp.]|uniref:hypothetical protein n=1 Tax=Ilumatobacter sp. TaxID=1967498 RepID=UPI00329A1A99
MTTTALVGLLAAGCGTASDSSEPASTAAAVTTEASVDTSAPTEPAVDTDADADEPRVVSGEEGALARRAFEVLDRTEVASSSVAVADSSMMCGGVYEPTAEEIAETNKDSEGLIEAFDRFGIAYTSSTDDVGYLSVDYAFDDVVARSVADSYWSARYPVEPIPQEELDAIVAQNDVVAGQFDAAGLDYERVTDESGYESVVYDYEDPAAQAAVDAAWLIISPPQPPTAEQLTQQNADNEKLTAAFDAAGLEYELVTDELGWAWVEWDDSNPDTAQAVADVFDELYPPVAIDPVMECEVVGEPVPIDLPTIDVEPVEPVEEIVEAPVDNGPTPEQIAASSAAVDAMVAGFTEAAVEFDVVGESPWQSVMFDLDDDASVQVIAGVRAGRG